MRLAARWIKHARMLISDYLALAGLIGVWVVSIITLYSIASRSLLLTVRKLTVY